MSDSNVVVIYHGNCPDGFGAALAAWMKFGDSAIYYPMQHRDILPDISGKDVFMLDIAFSEDTMNMVNSKAKTLTVLDHHYTTQQGLLNFKCTCGKVHFDLNHSAAYMSWKYFHPDKAVPELIKFIEDRDLLKWTLEDSRDYLGALDIGPYHFRRWMGILNMPKDKYNEFITRGKAVYLRDKQLSEMAAQDAMDIELCGFIGKIANAPNVLHSMVSEFILESSLFAAVWCLEDSGKLIKVGLRSKNFDVSQIAMHFGGGGHPYASAFKLPIEQLPLLLQNKFKN